jgi:hypothetical protein
MSSLSKGVIDITQQLSDGPVKNSGFIYKVRMDTFPDAWTQDEGFIELSKNFIAHNLILNLYSASLDKETSGKVEKFAAKVYKQYFDYTDEEFSLENHLK